MQELFGLGTIIDAKVNLIDSPKRLGSESLSSDYEVTYPALPEGVDSGMVASIESMGPNEDGNDVIHIVYETGKTTIELDVVMDPEKGTKILVEVGQDLFSDTPISSTGDMPEVTVKQPSLSIPTNVRKANDIFSEVIKLKPRDKVMANRFNGKDDGMISGMMNLRVKDGSLDFNPRALKAIALSLDTYRKYNFKVMSEKEKGILQSINIGFAMEAIEDELNEVVIRDVLNKSLDEIRDEIKELYQKALNNKLAAEDLDTSDVAWVLSTLSECDQAKSSVSSGILGYFTFGKVNRQTGTTYLTMAFNHEDITGAAAQRLKKELQKNLSII